MSRRSGYVGVVAILLAGLSGCCNARLVSLDQNGGVVAIPSNTNFWPTYYRDKAEALIAQKCPEGYQIEREEEFVVGTTHIVRTNTEKTGDPLLAALKIAPIEEQTTQTTSSTDQTEWRIWFQANKASPAGPDASDNPRP
jgi:hypothetical protein